MVDISIDWQRFEFDFNGETVSMELHPLKSKAVFMLMRVNPETADDSQIQVMQDIFAEYVRNIENLTINNQPVEPVALADYPQFMGLASEVMAKLTTISNLGEPDKKKSGKQ